MYMRLNRRLLVFIALVLLTVPALGACTFEVQPIEEYATPDGILTITFPAEWSPFSDPGMLTLELPSLAVSSEPDLTELDALSSDAAALVIYAMPESLAPPVASVADEAKSALDVKRYTIEQREEAIADSNFEVGDIRTFTMADDRTVYAFTVADEDRRGAFYALSPPMARLSSPS